MSPLRFRAWLRNPNEHRMVYFPLEKDGETLTFIVDDGRVQYITYPSGTQYEVDWMQSTGLLDKNGKEIFEGDIYHYFDYYGNVVGTDAVKWESHRDAEDGEHTGYPLGPEFTKGWAEVIGNIYENPELLSKAA